MVARCFMLGDVITGDADFVGAEGELDEVAIARDGGGAVAATAEGELQTGRGAEIKPELASGGGDGQADAVGSTHGVTPFALTEMLPSPTVMGSPSLSR